MATAAVVLFLMFLTSVASIPRKLMTIDGAFVEQFPQPRYRREYPYGVNSAEFWNCVQPWNMRNCKKGLEHAKVAAQEAARKYPGVMHNDNGDAFRHCYWNARMTIDMGESEAKAMADRHEKTSQPPLEIKMDKFNNEKGRLAGKSKGSYDSAMKECVRLVGARKLLILVGGKLVPSG